MRPSADRWVAFAGLAALLASTSGCAAYGTGGGPGPSGETELPGYLTPAALSRIAALVPPPAAEGSPEQAADRALSDRYRALEGSDRWLLATAHAELSPGLALQHFDCTLGIRSAGAPTPRLVVIFERVMADADAVTERVKARDPRPRPVAVDPSRPACQRLSAASRASPSYPSGSAAVGAAYAGVLAAAQPDRAEAVREIGHQIALSRVVCAMHYPADAAEGEAVGRATFDAIAATPAFQADLLVARNEIAAVRATGLTHPGCAAERAALALPTP